MANGSLILSWTTSDAPSLRQRPQVVRFGATWTYASRSHKGVFSDRTIADAGLDRLFNMLWPLHIQILCTRFLGKMVNLNQLLFCRARSWAYFDSVEGSLALSSRVPLCESAALSIKKSPVH